LRWLTPVQITVKFSETELREHAIESLTLSVNLYIGAVMAARHFKNPISISRKIMEESPHCAFSADGALAFAKEKGFDTYICEPQDLITDKAKSVKDKYKFGDFVEEVFPGNNPCENDNYDTVSAVALDSNGHFACATSTG
jgi:isoaspartyl peptidase/L-asparaginase-like protein (Ntn-hydrolase superfamily)